MRQITGLICILCEAGLSYRRAAHIAKAIDRGCFLGMLADDFAGLLLDWSNKRAYKRLELSQKQIDVLTGFKDESLYLFDPN